MSNYAENVKSALIGDIAKNVKHSVKLSKLKKPKQDRIEKLARNYRFAQTGRLK